MKKAYSDAREMFIERLKTIATLANHYASLLEEDVKITPDDMDIKVRNLGSEVNNLAYIQGAASAFLIGGENVDQ